MQNSEPDPNCQRCGGTGNAVGDLVDVYTGQVTLRNVRVPCDCMPSAIGIAAHCNVIRHYVPVDAPTATDAVAQLEAKGWTSLHRRGERTLVGTCPDHKNSTA